MAGEIEEPFRLNFQADLLHSGSISFGRFESESLSWERRSSFSHNRYLEEVEKYSKPGSVSEKKAYFEAHFRRKALLKQTSSESQDLQELENGNESNHFTCFNESSRSSNHSKYYEETETQNESMINNVDHMASGPEHLKLEETHQSETDNVVLVKSIISSEASKAKTRESKGLLIKEKEKKSPRYASPATHSGKKTSKLEESSMSFPKVKRLPPNISIVKEYRSEKTMETKSLPGARQTLDRTKQAVTTPTPSKPLVNQSAAGFTFKRDKQRSGAAELIQSQKRLNFKATPMPSFYKESTRYSEPNKISTSKKPHRPQTSSITSTTNRISTARPSSSTSLTSKNRPSELPKKSSLPEKRVQEKKKDLNSQKQKEAEASKGIRGRHTLRRNDLKLVST